MSLQVDDEDSLVVARLGGDFEAPSWTDGGEWVGADTSAVEPWPHQARAFQRMYDQWPPKLLIADEVGLGKNNRSGSCTSASLASGESQASPRAHPPRGAEPVAD